MEKGKTPKGRMSCRSSLGHAVKSCMTVIRVTDGALSEDILTGTFAGAYHAGVYVLRAFQYAARAASPSGSEVARRYTTYYYIWNKTA